MERKLAELEIRPLRADFGAEVIGLEPALPLPAETRRRLKAAFDQYGLLVFPELVDDARFQTYLSELFAAAGDVDPAKLEVHEKFQVSNRDEKSAAPFGRLLYHHEYMWIEDGCRVASLYGRVIEQPSVPTLFVSAKDAWETLPADLRAQVEGRFALHCQDATEKRRDNTSDVLTVTFPVTHFARLPIGYQHPRLDQTVLYVCPLATDHIEGMDYDACETLLEKLFEHLYAPDKVLEHRWRQGDLVIWDNYTVQHARPNLQMGGAARVLRKTMTPHPGVQEHASRPVFATVGM